MEARARAGLDAGAAARPDRLTLAGENLQDPGRGLARTPLGRSSRKAPSTRLADRPSSDSLPLHGYVPYKIQTAPSCVSALGSPKGARHD